MQRNRRILTASTVLVALVLAWSACPNPARAEVNRGGVLDCYDDFCPHRAGCYERIHEVNLKAGQAYVIDLTSNRFDTYLFLEDSSGRVLARNDDGGVGTNSRIIFTPTRNGTYRLVVTTYRMGALGAYRLRVAP